MHEKRLKEIESRLAEIKTAVDQEGADIDTLTTETETLIGERKKILETIEKRSKLLSNIASGASGEVVNTLIPPTDDDGGMERRAKKFAETSHMAITAKESRSVLISSGKLATPTNVSGINDAFNTVSSIVDMVDVQDCTGMGSDIIAYEINGSEAGDTTEGNKGNESDPGFDYVTITPKSTTVLSYVSRQVKKQSPLLYEQKVKQSAFNALRKKAAKVITDAIKVSTITEVITTISSIDATTLRKITMNYGGDENIMGDAVLFLNKKDLVAFGDIRGTNEKKAVYEITPDSSNPNTGIIKDGGLAVRYCINSNCTALTGSTNSSTTAVLPTMFYGQPKCARLDLFGDYEVRTSEDYKFGEGLLSVLGDVDCGADVVVNKGFVVVALPKKSA